MKSGGLADWSDVESEEGKVSGLHNKVREIIPFSKLRTTFAEETLNLVVRY